MLAWYCCNGIVILYTPPDICSTIPCGANAICREHNGVGSCACLPDYYGDPYFGCKPECLQSFDCPCNFACINAKCVDPCENACGMNAECSVVNHSPMCYCIPDYTGNALFGCYPVPDNGKTHRWKIIIDFVEFFSLIPYCHFSKSLFTNTER